MEYNKDVGKMRSGETMKNTFIFLLIFAVALIAPASGTIAITPGDITTSSISWTWAPTTITNASVDGVIICGFDPVATSFTLSGLGPGELHTLKLLSAGDSGSNSTKTLEDAGKESNDAISGLLNSWVLLFIVIVVCCAIGMMRRLGIFLIAASAVSLYGLYNFITVNVMAQGQPLIEIPFLIFIVFIIIPLWLVWGVKRGVFK
jgi:hypothetical protein